MRIDVLTLFPEAFAGPLTASIPKRAAQAGAVSYHLHDIRAHTADKHGKVDQPPYGGGPGMVMQCQPVWDAVQNADRRALAESERSEGAGCPDLTHRRIYLSPQGRRLDQSLVHELASVDRLTLICGHYEGLDERVLDRLRESDDGLIDVSIGDYVLSGGELPAMVVIDAVVRLLHGVLGDARSIEDESFSPTLEGGLDYPHYTRPETWNDRAVPEVLRSGDHARIDAWRRERSAERTRKRRPDLVDGGGPGDARASVVVIREATPDDADAIAAVHRAAFAASAHGYAGEDELVAACQAEGETIFSDVATARVGGAQRVIGHAMWSSVEAVDQPGRRGMLGVGPIGVLPAWQGRGVGTALMQRGIDQARDARCMAVFVLGDPAYYERFGFRPASAFGWGNPYGVDAEFMALPLRGEVTAERAGQVRARARCFQPDALAELEARHRG